MCPVRRRLFLSDSEVDESPFFGANNLFALNTDGRLKPGGARSLLSFTKEPTGLAFDPTTGHMLVSDDSGYKVYWVDPANPTVKLGEFLTKPLGGSDPEDIAVDPDTGHLFICNGSGNTNTPGIIETDRTGTQVFDFIAMPSVITDPEALAYDAAHDVFYVGGKFSANIWVIDRDGTILETIGVLASYPRENGGASEGDGPGACAEQRSQRRPGQDEPLRRRLWCRSGERRVRITIHNRFRPCARRTSPAVRALPRGARQPGRVSRVG